ncbi:MAG: hypothetical protein GF329_02340 [Candidatus Lokiarchaeota archaeon]|nr:hypothetical protein [Candidatus Lokiarchaeota archaeon]
MKVIKTAKFEKLALPITMEHPEDYGYYYMDIGHAVATKKLVDLWTIDRINGRLKLCTYTTIIEDAYHSYSGCRRNKNTVAWGRCILENGENKCSMALTGDETYYLHPKHCEYMKRKVEQILDKKYNNPIIILF